MPKFLGLALVLAMSVTLVLGCAPAPTPTPVLPTAVPPTAVPPTKVPPTAVPLTAVPPTAVPPTAVPKVNVAGDGPVGGTLVTGALMGMEPKSLNPNFRRDDGALRVAALVYCQLVETDFIYGSGVYPELAERWEINPDATVFTFYLVKNAKWHDGKPVTSADVAWTINETISKKGSAVDYVKTVTRIDTPDPYTVIITLSEPNSAFVNDMGFFYGPKIMPKHLYEGTDWATNPNNDKPVGCGPFKFVEWVKGSYLSVAANLDYYRGRPHLDKLVMRFYAMETLVSALEAGEVKFSYENVPASEVIRLRQNPNLRVDLSPVPLVYWLAFNLKKPPLDDVRVRRAFALAIDREDISKRVFQGFQPATWGVMPKSWAYNKDAEFKLDLAKAAQLLDEAGLKPGADGVRLKVTVTVAAVMSFPDCLKVIAEHLKKIGIALTIESLDWAGYTQKVTEQRNFEMAGGGGNVGWDPAGFEPFVMTGGYRNIMGYSNKRVDDLLKQARASGDLEKRKQAYFEMQRIIIDEVPRIAFVEDISAFPYGAEVKSVYWSKDVLGKPGNMDYSFLYTYLSK